MLRNCPKFTKFLVGSDEDATKVVRARCKQWSCSYCAKINAMVWMYRIRDTIDDQKAWAFVTFTSPSEINESPVSTEFSLKIMQRGWKKFREALRYKRGKKFRYLRVYEIQEDTGRYHIHAIIEHTFDDIKVANEGKKNEYTYSRWQKDNIKKWGFGVMCNASNFRRNGSDWTVARYIAKYLTKGDDKIGDDVRRFQASHGFAKARVSENDIDWQVQNDINHYDMWFYTRNGGYVEDITAGNMITSAEVTQDTTYRQFIEREEKNEINDNDNLSR